MHPLEREMNGDVYLILYLDESNLAGSLQGINFRGQTDVSLLLAIRTRKIISHPTKGPTKHTESECSHGQLQHHTGS